jgi:transcription antitermination factor NusG
VLAGRELLAASQLRHLGFPTYVPILVAAETRLEVVRAPMFPGYLFLGLGDLSEHRPFEAPELTGLLRQTDGTPVPVPERLLDDLRARSGEDGAIRLAAARETLLAGALATITEGPLAGLQATVLTASRDWVRLLLHVLGRDVPTTLPRHAVRQVQP